MNRITQSARLECYNQRSDSNMQIWSNETFAWQSTAQHPSLSLVQLLAPTFLAP